MACVEVKTKKYQTRKGPPYHAKDCKGLVKKVMIKKIISLLLIKKVFINGCLRVQLVIKLKRKG